MKKLDLVQMENLQGGKCSQDQVLILMGATVALSLLSFGTASWIGAGAVYACVLANS